MVNNQKNLYKVLRYTVIGWVIALLFMGCDNGNDGSDGRLGIGHFVFEEDGMVITSLQLSPNQIRTVSLINDGNGPIFGVAIAVPQELQEFINVSCDQFKVISVDGSCRLEFNTTDLNTEAKGSIVASGINRTVSDTPTMLPVVLSSKGHFGFQRQGTFITQLNISPNQSVTVELTNTGGETITDFSLSVTDKLSDFFDSGDCGMSDGLLSPGETCHFHFNTSDVTATITGAVTAAGNFMTVNNTPDPLQVIINSTGHFTFERDNQENQPITSLNLAKDSKGYVLLTNAGSITITNFNVSLSNNLDNVFDTSDCENPGGLLGAGASCKIHFDTSNVSSNMSGEIIASGEDTTVNPSSAILSVDISLQGHFVFEQNGHPIQQLNIAANSSGIVTLNNTGSATIDGVSVMIEQALQSFFDASNCQNSLSPYTSCSISYGTGTLQGSIYGTIQATGTSGADNSPQLNVTLNKDSYPVDCYKGFNDDTPSWSGPANASGDGPAICSETGGTCNIPRSNEAFCLRPDLPNESIILKVNTECGCNVKATPLESQKIVGDQSFAVTHITANQCSSCPLYNAY